MAVMYSGSKQVYLAESYNIDYGQQGLRMQQSPALYKPATSSAQDTHYNAMRRVQECGDKDSLIRDILQKSRRII
jgi:hypothetical protein